MMYPVHPYRLATVLSSSSNNGSSSNGGSSRNSSSRRRQGNLDLLQIAKDTYASGGGNNGNTGWKQAPINAAYMGLQQEAQKLEVRRRTIQLQAEIKE